MAMISGSTGMVRVDTSRMEEYLMADKPKLSFGQKLARGFGKALAFAGPIGATILAASGVGLPAAYGLAAASNVAGQLTSNAETNDVNEMNSYMKSKSQMPVGTPGLYDQSSAVDMKVDFLIPQNMNSQTSLTMQDRQGSINSNVQDFNFR